MRPDGGAWILACVLACAGTWAWAQDLVALGTLTKPPAKVRFQPYIDLRCAALFAAFEDAQMDVTLDMVPPRTSSDARSVFEKRVQDGLLQGSIDTGAKVFIKSQRSSPVVVAAFDEFRAAYLADIASGMRRSSPLGGGLAPSDLSFCRDKLK